VNVAVFDLETNGLTGSSVLSASSIVFNGEGAVLDLFNRFYLPVESLDRSAVRVHGLTPGRLLALRERAATPLYFVEDWPELLGFWAAWEVAGVVAHNLSFDVSFLPEAAQGTFLWWCSMKGLTEYCALPKRSGGSGTFKWPRLGEATTIVCDGPNALPSPEETQRAENAVGEEGMPHVSLYDCFQLYRVVGRVAKHRRHLLRFAPFLIPYSPPKKRRFATPLFPTHDVFTRKILESVI
jgi:hypothetical protein